MSEQLEEGCLAGSPFFDLDLVHTVAFRQMQLHTVTGKPREHRR